MVINLVQAYTSHMGGGTQEVGFGVDGSDFDAALDILLGGTKQVAAGNIPSSSLQSWKIDGRDNNITKETNTQMYTK